MCSRAIYKTTDVYLHYTLYSIHIYIGSEITLSLLNTLYTLYRQLINIIYWHASNKDPFYMTPVSLCFQNSVCGGVVLATTLFV